MASKFSPHQNILQPKRLNSAETCKGLKGGHRQGIGATGPTLTLNGVTIDLPSTVHSITSIGPNIPSKKGTSTMAKRNARERNRVKQVNLGFQTLRNHIPEGYRMKKMSKVDTLRCAVEYIRSMEQILEITPLPSLGDNFIQTDSPYQSFSSPEMNQQQMRTTEDGSNISMEQSFSSFSENEENPDCSPDGPKPLIAVYPDMTPRSTHRFSAQEQCEPSTSMTMVSSESNTIPYQALVTTAGDSPAPLILPLQLHPHPMDKNIDVVPSDENFIPPSTGYIVEIVRLQS